MPYTDPRDELLTRLTSRQLDDGGFGQLPHQPSRSDPTAWAGAALRALDPALPELAAVLERLESWQQPDGRVPVAADQLDAAWPTSLALAAWTGIPGHEAAADRSAAFLIATSGVHISPDPDSPVGHDTSIVGWSWTDGAHSWVEPTALAVLALTSSGHGADPRVDEARRMIADRQLPDGGWNYGNTIVFDVELEPTAEGTGPALAALAGWGTTAAVEGSLSHAADVWRQLTTPVAAGWVLMGLTAWNRRPGDASAAVSAILERSERFGGYTTEQLSLLALGLAGGFG